MINTKVNDYYENHLGVNLSPQLIAYIRKKDKKNANWETIMIFFMVSVFLATIGLAKPIFAEVNKEEVKDPPADYVYLEKNFKENIKNKYGGNYIYFPNKGIAHIRKTIYINKKPIKINIVELNTKVNPNLKIKPEIASEKLKSKRTVRRIAQKENALIAINGGFFKPTNGVPLGALMIDKEVITGPIYNRVGIAIFEENNETRFKMQNIDFDIQAKAENFNLKIDNINQPRMMQSSTLLYTSIWGDTSPIPAKNGYNLLIRDKKAIKMSANPIAISGNDLVIQGSKENIIKLAKNKEIDVQIKAQEELKDAKHIIGAGPYLVKNNEIYVDAKSQRLLAITGKNPRSAVGYKDDGTFILVTVDGREKTSVGMTLYELARLMKKLDCKYAMNFDGGSSSALYVKGRIVNSAINKEGIAVSNALIVTETNPDELQISSI